MKKSLVAVAVLAFALGAMADTLPLVNWFSATPGSLDDGTWNVASPATEPLVEENAWVIDTEPGVDDAVYTPKTLKSGKKTRVTMNIAFGAAYTTLPTPADGAQTGLVLGIDDNETSFYGLVDGGWKKLTGGVPADLDTSVDVTIEIDYEASPVTVSFTVGDTVLTDAGDSSVSTFARYAGTATWLTSVGFVGSGVVASIAGNSDPKYVVDGTGYLDFAAAMAAAGSTKAIELYSNAAYEFPTTGNAALKIKPTGSYTFTPTPDAENDDLFYAATEEGGVTTYQTWQKVVVTIPDAEGAELTVEATGSGNDPIPDENGDYTVALDDKVTATYEATEGNVFTGGTGKETTAVVVIENVKGGEEAEAPTAVTGKAKYNDELYATVQDAVTAAEAGSDIVIVADSTDEVLIGKAVTFTGDADYVVGAITLTEGGTLTIEKGKYCVLNPVTTGNLVLKGGFYQTIEEADAQTMCPLGYFAQTIVGTSYITQVVKGEVIEAEDPELPAIAVEPGVAVGDTPAEKAATLKTIQENGQPLWVNYALGIDGTDAANQVEFTECGDEDTVILDLGNGELKAGTGLTAEIQKYDADAKSWDNIFGVFELDDSATETEVGEVRIVLKDDKGKEVSVKEATYGIKKETPAAALSIVSVPFTKLGSTDALPLLSVMKDKNFAVGDKIHRYNPNSGENETWTLGKNGWAGVGGDDNPMVKPGEGIWVERADNSKPVFFFGGFQTAKAATTVTKNQWALAANPNLTDSLTLDEIVQNPTADMQVTIETGAEPKIYTYEDGAWGYNKKTVTERKVGKKVVSVQTITRDTETTTIAPGQGFWFASGAEADSTLNWTKSAD